MGFYQLKKEQIIKRSPEEIWDFISDPMNLQIITPPTMGFSITSDLESNKMYPGMIISYKVTPLLGIPMTWVTEITHVEDKKYFVDEQRIGPYKMWHHEHILGKHPEGTRMIDIISYQPPFGFLGTVANMLIIKGKLQQIFDYRFHKIEELFN